MVWCSVRRDLSDFRLSRKSACRESLLPPIAQAFRKTSVKQNAAVIRCDTVCTETFPTVPRLKDAYFGGDAGADAAQGTDARRTYEDRNTHRTGNADLSDRVQAEERQREPLVLPVGRVPLALQAPDQV